MKLLYCDKTLLRSNEWPRPTIWRMSKKGTHNQKRRPRRCCARPASNSPSTLRLCGPRRHRRVPRQLGVDEHAVVKTLVMQDDKAEPLIVLMHGDCTVSLKELAADPVQEGRAPADLEVAQRHSGYTVGGTSPFACARRCRCMWRRPSWRCRASASTAAGAATSSASSPGPGPNCSVRGW